MKFIKKPIIIEAIQYTGDNAPEVLEFCGERSMGTVMYSLHGFVIKTLEGEMIASRGDWIIVGVKGELYPCKPDVFEASYEAVQ